MQERDTEWSALTIAHHIHGASKPLETTVAQRYGVPWDWLWDACYMAGVRWGSCCKDFVASKARTIALSKAWGTWQSTLFMSLEIPWGFLTRAVLCSLAGLMSRKKVLVWEFLWVRKVWFTFAQWMFASETFGKRRKGERLPVVSQLPCSHEHLASRNPRVLCEKYGGACTMYQLGVPEVWETGQKLDSRAAKKGAKKLVCSDFAKILDKKVATKIRETCEKT